MNIFLLDNDVHKSVEYYVDKHVVKIPTEIAQMCVSALRKWGAGDNDVPPTKSGSPMKISHPNHPITLWMGRSRPNYLLGLEYLRELCREYTYRYGRHHYYEQFIPLFHAAHELLPVGPSTIFSPAMPDEYKVDDVVQSYRNYYKFNKLKTIQCRWTKREIPLWITG